MRRDTVSERVAPQRSTTHAIGCLNLHMCDCVCMYVCIHSLLDSSERLNDCSACALKSVSVRAMHRSALFIRISTARAVLKRSFGFEFCCARAEVGTAAEVRT